jgi:hypothetical protein
MDGGRVLRTILTWYHYHENITKYLMIRSALKVSLPRLPSV